MNDPRTSLCIHDAANPEGCACWNKESLAGQTASECPGRTKDCACGNCFYGRDPLAVALLAERFARFRQPGTAALDCAIVTGSRAYGHPKPESDLDLVVQLAGGDIVRVVEALGLEIPKDQEGTCYPTLQFKSGRLNLIMETDPERFEVWRKGTRTLKAMAPVTRDQAVALFRDLRKQVAS